MLHRRDVAPTGASFAPAAAVHGAKAHGLANIVQRGVRLTVCVVRTLQRQRGGEDRQILCETHSA